MRIPRLIAITGAAGAGKDTLADEIVRLGGMKYSFAAPLKQALNAMFGWTMEQWNDREWKEAVIPWLGKSPRQLAQTLGTEWGRGLVHPELWVLLFKQRYEEHRETYGDRPFVVADCRFDNEAVAVASLGGVVLQVQRPGIGGVSAHVSERGVNGALVDAYVINNTDRQDYIGRALQTLAGLETARTARLAQQVFDK